MYDAIIVLAHEMDKQGNLNSQSLGRLSVAVNALQQHESDIILTTGWPYRMDSEIAICDSMRNHAINNYKIPENQIFADSEARDTVGDAIFTKKNFALRLNWRKLLVVTSDYHTERTLEIFKFIYGPDFKIDIRGAPLPESNDMRVSEANSTLAFRKTFSNIEAGDDKNIIKRLYEAHPFYNGTINPKRV